MVQDLHDLKRIVMVQNRLGCRAFWFIIHLHENHSTKRAGVTGMRELAIRIPE